MSSNQEPQLPEIPNPGRLGAEHLPTKMLYAVLIGALVIFAIAVYLADLMRVHRTERFEQRNGKATVPAQIGQSKIGMVEQNLFELQHGWADLRREQMQRLTTYGWADRSKSEIHIPIDEAMKRVAAEGSR